MKNFYFAADQQLEIVLIEIEAERSVLREQYAEVMAQLDALSRREIEVHKEYSRRRVTCINVIADYLLENRWADRPIKQPKEHVA